jgi:hypothetical protein
VSRLRGKLAMVKRRRRLDEGATSMTDIHANAALHPIVISGGRQARHGWSNALPPLLLLIAIFASSAVAAITDPMVFTEIFSRL